MGVLKCCRRDCLTVMCDRYSVEYGYICGDCFSELVNHGRSVSIKDFMDTPKNDPSYYDDAVEYYDSIFSIQRDTD